MNSIKYIALFFTVALVSCGTNHEDLMTKLSSEKKSAEDSLRIVTALEMDFQRKARSGEIDSIQLKSLVDSFTHYHREGARFKMELDKIEFSLDSLSAIK